MMYENIEGKKILLLMPNFFNYPKLLIEELESRGATVIFVENKLLPFDYDSPLCKFRFFRKVVFLLFSIKYNYLTAKTNFKEKYDFFLCINGFLFDKRIILKLKAANPNIKTLLYLWDSTNMFEWKNITQYFDKSFTFDPLDAEKLNISYLPNFYPKSIEKNNRKTSEDLFFVGTQHADRYEFLKKIIQINRISTKSIKLYVKYKHSLHSKFIYYILKRSKGSFAQKYCLNYDLVERIIKDDFLIYESMSPEKISDLISLAKCVLDIQAPTQVGLPHQLIIALAMGKKIITVNSWMVNYDFYNPNQILIIDRDNPIISSNFLKREFEVEEVSASIKRSRIDNWVDIIFEIK